MSRVTLPEPIEIAKFWKSRRRDIAIVASLSEHFIGSDGCMKPTTKGLAMVVRRLPELAAAVTMALAKARELGLIDDDGAGE